MKIIAHRSGPTICPEQTIISAKLALDAGADLIELDVRFTRDKKIVVSHDCNANRIFGIDKEIANMSAKEFLSLRHKENPAFSSHLFEDYLVCGVEPLLIHIKEDEVIDEILKYINEYDYSEKIIFGVHNTQLVSKIKTYDPRLKVLAFMPSTDDIQAFGESEVDYIRLWEKWASEENISLIRKFGKEVWVMTCDRVVGITTQKNLRKILSMNVDAILINDVAFLMNILHNRI